MSLTVAQIRAIKARGNVLVVAGAGTGKTRTLVERCLHCLLDKTSPVSLEQILVVTFTEAAATEIRQRLRLRLEQELNEHPEDIRWHEQLALFDTAHIGTLHSFCLQLIRPHFYELAIDPQMSVMAEDEAQLLANETLSKVLDGHYEGRSADSPGVQQLIHSHGAGSDHAIRALVLRLHHHTQTLPDPDGWFDKQLALFSASKPVQWLDWLLKAFTDWREEWLSSLQSETGNELAKQCVTFLNSKSGNLDRVTVAATLEKFSKFLAELAPNKRPAWLKNLDSESQFLSPLAEGGEKIDPLGQDWQWVREAMVALLNLAREFGKVFNENKRQLGVLDFHDLEQHALRLLWDPETTQASEVAAQWRQKLRFIFVDEYQDINAAQDKIIEAISGQGSQANRFLVGDVKQSIYRFRQADPHIFQHYAATWCEGTNQTIMLGDNFRSREGILSFINALFHSIMRTELGGVCYDKSAELLFGASSERSSLKSAKLPSPEVELHLRIKANGETEADSSSDDGVEELIDLEEAAKEARLVALRLRELKSEAHPVWDEVAKRFRPVTWGDIAVLLRSPSGKSECYAKEFTRLKVPLVVQRSGFYQSLEVSDLVNLLQLLDNPLQDVPVLAVLHSPFAGLTVTELAEIRLAAKGPFWTALVVWHDGQKAKIKRQNGAMQNAEGSKDAPADHVTFRKVSAFLDHYARWRRLARQSSLSRCLDIALAETQYDTFLLTQPRGEQRHANVQRLLGLAQQFDHFQRQGLFRFLRHIEAQKRAGTEPEVKPQPTGDSVQLMSIHQSKGLEFPVVVVADLNKPFNSSDLRAAIILDEEYGLCPKIKPPHTGKVYPSLPYWLAKRRQQRELLGEELRLLYVAMTRARDTLILSASISEKRLEAIGSGKFKIFSLKDARSVFDWIALWFSKHYAEAAPSINVNGSEFLSQSKLSGCPATGAETASTLSLPASGQTNLLLWKVHCENKLLEPGAKILEEIVETEPEENSEVWLRLQERLSWKYPAIAATRIPAKASVTALRQRASALLEQDISFPHLRNFISPNRQPGEPKGFRKANPTPSGSAAEMGSAHHHFLQLMDIERSGSIAELKQEARRLAQTNNLTEEELALLNFRALEAFWSSELGLQIRANAANVHRELQFTTRFPPQTLAELIGEPPVETLPNEFVVVQGVADLVILKPKEILLIDFKTDSLALDSVAARARFYEPQLKLYGRALAQIYDRPVSACWLYFLSCDQAVEITGI